MRTTEIIISGSAGELDWILPVAKELKDSGNRVSISFLKESAKHSFENNATLKKITLKNFSITKKVLVEDCNLAKWQLLTRVYGILFRNLHHLFHRYLDKFFALLSGCLFPRVKKLFKKKPSSIMVEFPSDTRLLGAILRGNNQKTIYFPHSPHLYYQDNLSLSEFQVVDKHNQSSSNRETYLFGSEDDIQALMSSGWRPVRRSKLIITGHPKYSTKWIKYFKHSLNNDESVEKLKIGVLSRGVGNFLSQDEHERLVKATHGAITKILTDFDVQVKLHPREVIGKNTVWKDFLTEGFRLSDDHVYMMFSQVDFVIIMFSSAAIDAAVWDVPAIEMYDPEISPALQLKRDGEYRTIYEIFGLVERAKNEKDLKAKISQILSKGKFDLKRSKNFESMVNKSENWLSAVQSEIGTW